MNFTEIKNMDDLNLIYKAIRNKKILKWWNSCEKVFRIIVIYEYAKYLKCPIREIDENFTGPNDLEWLYTRYQKTIEESEI